jgi:hypothetical protein
MKIRTGFVSNSSSSSFIIVLNDENRKYANYEQMVYDYDIVVMSGDKKVDEKKAKQLLAMGYEVDKDESKTAFGYISYKKGHKIYKTTDCDLSRDTSICFGDDFAKYIEMLEEQCENDEQGNIVDDLKSIGYEYGTNNLMFIRSSDENMGGKLPDELSKLYKNNIWEMETH